MKNPAVGWSVGRLVGFLRIFQSSTIKLFFEIQGSQGILDYILGKKKSIIERNLMMDCWPNFGTCVRIAFCLVSCYLWHPVHPLLSLLA